MPIRPDYFVSDLAVEMKLPVLVVAQNRLGCLNHIAFTVHSIVKHGLPCAGIVLNELPGAADVATATNADILREINDVPRSPWITGRDERIAAHLEANGGFRVTSCCVLVVNRCVNKFDTKICRFPRLPS